METYKNNIGLIASQNKDKRVIFENALKSYTAMIAGIGSDNEMLQTLFGAKEAKELSELGITKFCYKKTEELLKVYPFPSMPETKQEIKQAESKTDVCPDCGGVLKFREGVKNGKPWRGQFCQNKECKKVIWLPRRMSKQENDQAMQEDSILEESQQSYESEYPPENQ